MNEIPVAPVETGEQDEIKREKTPSLKKLIWRRFKRRRLGMISGIIIVILSLSFSGADFIAPYQYDQNHRRAPSVPPMWDRIHFFEDGQWVGPYVYGLQRTRDPNSIGLWLYGEDKDSRYPIQFFVKGEAYDFWGLFRWDIHLFGTGEPPTSTGQIFLLGTNQSGKDLFSQILVGGRISMFLVTVVIIASFFIGILLGGLSGYLGGWVDNVLQRLVEITMGLPRLALLLALSAAVPANTPPEIRLWIIIVVLAVVNWAPLARVIRGQFLALREEDYVFSAKAVGAGTGRIIFRHILPNTMSYLVVSATLAIPSVLILESVLSFLGFGLNIPLVSWGVLLKQFNDNFVLNIEFYTWLLTPGLFLFFTVLVFNLFGDALRDAVDPFTVDAETQ